MNIRLLSILFFLIYPTITNAQPNIQWQKTFGGTGNEYASEIRQTFDGGFIVSGYSESSDGDVTENYGGRDYWIVKITSSGVIEWEKSFGGTIDDVLQSVFQTSDSGYIVSGYSESNDSDVTGNHGHRDCWILKFDQTGAIERQRCFGGSDFEIAYSVQQTVDGGYVFGGYTNSNDGDLTASGGVQDYWVVKLDTFFNIEWQRQYGGTFTDEAMRIQQTADSGFIIAGYIYSSNGDITGYHGGQDCWVVKTDQTGILQWQKALGGTDNESGTDIIQTNDGGYLVAAYSASNDSDVSGNHGGNDLWIIKLNSSGSIEWQKSFGGTGDDRAYSILQPVNGGFIVAGISNSIDGDVSGNQGDYDNWIVSLDNAGIMQWQKTFGGTGIDGASSMKQTSDGGLILLGNSYSNDGDVSGNHGGSDFWVVKLDSSLSVHVNEFQNDISDFQISPNPFSKSLRISFRTFFTKNVFVEIHDIEGRLIKNISTGKISGSVNEFVWDATDNSGSNVDDGIYFVTVISDHVCMTKKAEVSGN